MLNLQCLTQNSLTKNYSDIENILHAFNNLEFLALIAENRKIKKKVSTLENEIKEQISCRKSREPITHEML